jgi:hypothetical protein
MKSTIPLLALTALFAVTVQAGGKVNSMDPYSYW